MALVFLLVLHRDLGSIDETATEIERAETILYHYPEGLCFSHTSFTHTFKTLI